MSRSNQSDDRRLVEGCLTGSETAWEEFYARFIGLMRTVVRKFSSLSPEDVEDLTQSAFMALTSALRTYDFEQSLARFVSLVTERVMIDEYRRARAAKRDGDVESTDFSDRPDDKSVALQLGPELPDEQLERAQLASRLRQAIMGLDSRCRELIIMRYLEELSFKEIAEGAGITENTATVQTRRCLDQLRERFKERSIRGNEK